VLRIGGIGGKSIAVANAMHSSSGYMILFIRLHVKPLQISHGSCNRIVHDHVASYHN